MDQVTLDKIAKTLGVSYKVLDNLSDGKKTYRARLVLTNNCDHPLKYDNWAIYLCHIRMIEPGHLPHSSTYEIPKTGVKITHINGCLFQLSPCESFKTLNKGDQVTIKFKAQYFSVAKSDIMPNWYLLYPKLRPALIESTVGEEMSFVEPFDTPESWKRYDYELNDDDGARRFDLYNPYNLQERFERQKCDVYEGSVACSVIPTPVEMSVENRKININTADWVIEASEELKEEANYLAEKLSLSVTKTVGERSKKITLRIDADLVVKDRTPSSEAYTLTVSDNPDCVTIIGAAKQGVFYGIQSLSSLLQKNEVPVCSIYDTPRYGYRGMHMDVSRNFHTKQQMLKLLDVMAMYKMNKFHFHLTDDEGWRLEIPGLEELTKVGSRRGHVNSSNMTSLLPLLGSGPDFSTSGSGYYTVEEYREILRYAKERHIEVIPEIDMPGHSHAAIKSMKARYQRFMQLKQTKKAKEFLLTDLSQDKHGKHSVQMFAENAMNPGLESTYAFVKVVVQEVKKMHEDISPLRIFHFGGDEVPYEAWEGSPACETLIDLGKVEAFEDLMEYFVIRVADIVADCGLEMGAWQDGVITDEDELEPIKRSKFRNKDVFVYAWQNVWESGKSGCAYRLANTGYKVVMAQGTHLYFDHPYEPDPEERGLYWACRFLDSRKTFTFMPDNIYANIDVKLTGEPISKDYMKRHRKSHEECKKPENIVGVQGQLWTELVRTSNQMDEMIFPRLLCLAERAWHKADWEGTQDPDQRSEQQSRDWSRFANILGQKELQRLDQLGVVYHLHPPGARLSLEDGRVELNCAYPGLPLYYSRDGTKTWNQYADRLEPDLNTDLHLCTRSADGKRSSRVVTMKKPEKL